MCTGIENVESKIERSCNEMKYNESDEWEKSIK